ncbi:hypothetical protein [Pseudomonas ogarae]|uniref:hypothetical protein n=1 Tax=Pseudomonas ogarae (strain DSM 112162 / CECT 30235 / F113) TaxID=1114970 RepID=UPI00069677A3|nr:hypothetical protein [Pseudomonas ogarae]
MTEVSLNQYGVPLYPKGHVGRLLVTLAAIESIRAANRPATPTSVGNITGLQKGNIDSYVTTLNSQFGTWVVKNGGVYEIWSWGEVLKKTGVRKYLTPQWNSEFLSPEDGEHMNLELQVDWHPSGNLTLKQRVAGEAMWTDIREPSGVWANSDHAEFYRVTARYIYELSTQGHKLNYRDSSY